MAFLKLITTAQQLNKLKKTLIEEKTDAIKLDQKHEVKKKWKHYFIDLKLRCKKNWRKIICCGESCCPKTCYKLRTEGSCENYTLKSVLGFFGGFLLTYIFFIVFVFQLNISLSTATVFCSVLGVILCVGMAFSKNVRCIVLLTLPQFFTKKGRQALLAYAFALALTGPARNTLHNLGILSESLACGQEQLKQAVRQILDAIKKPFLAIRDAIKKVVKTVKEVVKKIKEILMKIKRVIMAIVRVIKAAFEFLGKIINICNKELGTPFERCTRAFDNAITDCNAKLGPLFNWLCSITYIVKAVCYIVKIFDYVCMIVDFISNSIIGVVIRKVKSFIRHIKTFFYVRIRFSHSFQFQTNSSKTLREVAKGIVGEINERTANVRRAFAFMTSASTIFFIFIVFQTVFYRFKYLTNDRFDNKYIYPEFRQIDLQRAKHNRDTVLPLNKREAQLYAPIKSPKLIKTESQQLSKNAMVLLTATVKLATHCAADYCLFWVLTMITFYGRFQSKVQAPNVPKAHIVGKGLLADLLRAIVKAFQPMGIQLEIDTVPCLPVPIPPDYDRYVQILVVIIFCWILTLLQPYGLRFRNYIMGVYHPVRQKERTIWLYNTLLRRRSSFLKFARRQLRRKFGDKNVTKVTCKEWMRANLSCWCFRICCGDEHQLACMLCGEVFREGNRPIKCPTPNCPGIYCTECFADLQNICPLCRSPLEYGDLTDLEEEKDSSGDEPPPPPKKPCTLFKCCKKPKDSDEETLLPKEEPEEPGEESPETPTEDYATDISTDYSYSYQYEERLSEPYLVVPRCSFMDVEKQEMIDYADMRSFHEIIPPKDELESDTSITDYEFDIDVDIDNADKATSTVMKLNVGTEISGVCIPDAEIELRGFGKPIKKLPKCKVASPDQVPLLGESSSSSDDEPVKPKKVSKKVVSVGASTDSSEISSAKRVDFIGVPKGDVRKKRLIKKRVRKKVKEDVPFLQEGACYCPNIDDILPEYDESLISIPRSTVSTSTVPQDGKQNLKSILSAPSSLQMIEDLPEDMPEDIDYTVNIVPQLDLTGITTGYPSYDRAKLSSERFRNSVNYSEVCECSPRTPPLISLESSTLISGLNDLLQDGNNFEDIGGPSNLPRRRLTSNRHEINIEEFESPSSMDSIEFENQHRRLVKQYYKATNVVPKNNVQKARVKNSVARFFNKIFRKHKRPRSDLPQYLSDTDDSIELQSYNYNRNNWETICPGISTPTYPFGSQESEGTTDENYQEFRPFLERRIRGGESASFEAKPPVNTRIFQRTPNNIRYKRGLNLGQDFSRLSLPAKPKPPTTQDLLAKYFVSIEDLTPTRDPGLPLLLPTPLTPKLEPICENSLIETELQQIPERESTALNESLVATENEHNRTGKSVENSNGSSSVLSESFCLDILGSSYRDQGATNAGKYSEEPREHNKKGVKYPGRARFFRKTEEQTPSQDHLEVPSRDISSRSPVTDFHQPGPSNQISRAPRCTGTMKKDTMHRPLTRDSVQLGRTTNYTLRESWKEDPPQKLVTTSDKIQQTSRIDLQNSCTHIENSTPRPMMCECPERDVDKNAEPHCCTCCQQGSTSKEPHQSSFEQDYGSYFAFSTGPRLSTQPNVISVSKCISPKRTVEEYEEVWLPPPPPPPFRAARSAPPRRWSPKPLRCTCGACSNVSPLIYSPRHCGDYAKGYCSPRQCGDYENSSSSYISNDDDDDHDDYEELIDLQYQNQDEYVELVQELEETLKSRNRNRVRRAMMEFEERSKHNKPLEKPIINYDEASESEEPIIEKINNKLRVHKQSCCDGKNPCKCKKQEYSTRHEYRSEVSAEYSPTGSPAHWMRDPATGEWYKVRGDCRMKCQDRRRCKMTERRPCTCGLEDCYYCG